MLYEWIRGLWMDEPNSIATHLSVVEKFQNMLTSWWLERKSQGVTKIIRIHHVGTMNIYIKFHGNPSTTYNHSVWSKVLDRRNDQLRVALPSAVMFDSRMFHWPSVLKYFGNIEMLSKGMSWSSYWTYCLMTSYSLKELCNRLKWSVQGKTVWIYVIIIRLHLPLHINHHTNPVTFLTTKSWPWKF